MKKAVILAGIVATALIFGVSSNKAYAQEVSQEQPQQPAQVLIEVNMGDSLSKIANAHDSTYQRIFYANEFIENPDVIHPGDKVRIPSADETLNERPLPTQVAETAAKPTTQKKGTSSKTQSAKPKQVSTPALSGDVSVWDRLAACESGGNWSINTGNGYYGGLQFTASTWRSVGGSGLPNQASREEQIMRGQILQARSGWGQWPACTAKLGLR